MVTARFSCSAIAFDPERWLCFDDEPSEPPNPTRNRPSDRTPAVFFVGEEDRPPVRFFGEVVCIDQRAVCFHDAVEVTGPSLIYSNAMHHLGHVVVLLSFAVQTTYRYTRLPLCLQVCFVFTTSTLILFSTSSVPPTHFLSTTRTKGIPTLQLTSMLKQAGIQAISASEFRSLPAAVRRLHEIEWDWHVTIPACAKKDEKGRGGCQSLLICVIFLGLPLQTAGPWHRKTLQTE